MTFLVIIISYFILFFINDFSISLDLSLFVCLQGAPGWTGLFGAQGANGSRVSLKSLFFFIYFHPDHSWHVNSFVFILQGEPGPSGAVGLPGPQVFYYLLFWTKVRLLTNDLYVTYMSSLGAPGIRRTDRTSRAKGSTGKCWYMFYYNECEKDLTRGYFILHRCLHADVCLQYGISPWLTLSIFLYYFSVPGVVRPRGFTWS